LTPWTGLPEPPVCYEMRMFVVTVPFMLPPMQVDKGAIKFILSGANVMCPGLTSPGAHMSDLQSETVVVSFLFLSLPLFLNPNVPILGAVKYFRHVS